MKQSMIAQLLACGALLAACGAEDDASSQQAASSQAESASSQSAEEKQTVTGTIVDGTMHTIAIETAGGERLEFAIPDDADLTGAQGRIIGNTVEITYTGSIDGTDTSGATVTRLVETPASGESQTGPAAE